MGRWGVIVVLAIAQFTVADLQLAITMYALTTATPSSRSGSRSARSSSLPGSGSSGCS